MALRTTRTQAPFWAPRCRQCPPQHRRLPSWSRRLKCGAVTSRAASSGSTLATTRRPWPIARPCPLSLSSPRLVRALWARFCNQTVCCVRACCTKTCFRHPHCSVLCSCGTKVPQRRQGRCAPPDRKGRWELVLLADKRALQAVSSCRSPCPVRSKASMANVSRP